MYNVLIGMFGFLNLTLFREISSDQCIEWCCLEFFGTGRERRFVQYSSILIT